MSQLASFLDVDVCAVGTTYPAHGHPNGWSCLLPMHTFHAARESAAACLPPRRGVRQCLCGACSCQGVEPIHNV